MFYVTLVPTLILFAVALWAAFGKPDGTRPGIFIATAIVLVTLCVFAGFIPTVTIVFVAVASAAFGWRRGRSHRVRDSVALVFASLAVAYSVPAVMSIDKVREFARMRAEYPLESVADRVREPAPSGPLVPDAVKSLEFAEREIDEQFGRGALRGYILKRIHDEKTLAFVNSTGFGIGRMIREPSSDRLKLPPREPTPHQPRPRASSETPHIPAGVSDMNAIALVDFANPRGFGYVRDRDHVAGFESHGFTELPANTIARLELVSLLMHDEPAVYVSDHLPEMTRLRGVPTRPLDEFEATGVANLRQGEDLFESASHPARLLGSLRNAQQCVACHGGSRGDLLGAFSYTFR